MIPPKVQQVLDEMRGYISPDTPLGRFLNKQADALQSALEEMQQERQAIVDAATMRAVAVCEKVYDHYRWQNQFKWPENQASAETGCTRCESEIRALIGLPLPESGRN